MPALASPRAATRMSPQALLLAAAALLLVAASLVAPASAALNDALYRFVAAPSPEYSWTPTGQTLAGDGWTGHVLNMTSGRWLNDSYVSRSVWWHDLLVIVPDKLTSLSAGALLVAEGKNTAVPYGDDDVAHVMAGRIATETGIVTAVLYQVPNQPTVFYSDKERKERGEDSLVAYSWMEYIRTGCEEFAVYLPMARAAVRAMDTVTAFTATLFDGQGVGQFVIAGASKRGATSWLAGAYDASLAPARRRVLGIIPIVFNLLNFERGISQMYESLGGWTFAFKDYVREGVTQLLRSKDMERLTAVVDPWSYREELAQVPKLICSATGDEFFDMTNPAHFFDGLGGDANYLLTVPNAEHTMATGLKTMLAGIAGFVTALTARMLPPTVASTLLPGKGSRSLVARASAKPSRVTLWRATTTAGGTPLRRDFRMLRRRLPETPCAVPVSDDLCLNPLVWVEADVTHLAEPVTDEATGLEVWEVHHNEPAPAQEGLYRGFFLEFQFPGLPLPPGGPAATTAPSRATSHVGVVPDTFPFQPCAGGEACKGELV